MLNRTDHINLFCLHYVYVPHINLSLAWICHPLSSMNVKTPLQFYYTGHKISKYIENMHCTELFENLPAVIFRNQAYM